MKSWHKVLAALLAFVLAFPYTLFALSMEEERRYGRQIYLEVARSAPINTDPYISIYVNGIRAKIESGSNMPPFPITLTVIDSRAVDAFATIGGYVFITTGLLALCEREDELAGVLGHEFTHVGRRHVAKRMEKDKYLNIGMLSTILLALLAGDAKTKEATLMMGAASNQALSLKYSREDEDEADRLGSALTDRVGYGALGTADFLKKLRATSDSKAVPQYLLTHPWHEERIVKLESMWPSSKVTLDISFYPFIRTRAEIMSKPLGTGTEEIWMNRYKKDSADPVNAYGAAFVQSLKGNTAEAVKIVTDMKSPYKALFLGEMLVNAHEYAEAIEVLKNDPTSVGRIYLARAYEGLGNREMAVRTLRDLLPYAQIYPEIYHRLGMLAGRMGNEGEGYANLGRFYLAVGRVDQAKHQLERAVSKYGMNSREGREILGILDEMNEKKEKK